MTSAARLLAGIAGVEELELESATEADLAVHLAEGRAQRGSSLFTAAAVRERIHELRVVAHMQGHWARFVAEVGSASNGFEGETLMVLSTGREAFYSHATNSNEHEASNDTARQFWDPVLEMELEGGHLDVCADTCTNRQPAFTALLQKFLAES
jgi:hypothetical protein